MQTLYTIIEEHKNSIKQIFKLAKADLIKTYSGAALGWAWALVKPTITIAVFWFAFTYGFRHGSTINGYSFVLWMIPGFMAWFYMSDMLTLGADSIRKYRYLVTKMKFPVSTIPTFVSISKLSIHIGLMAITMMLFIMSGHMPNIYWLQWPIYMMLMFAFWTAWGLFSAMFSAMSKDFLNLVKALSQAIFWLSGIMWDVNSIGIPTMKTILYFNPVTFLATGYRNCFIYGTWIWEEPLQLVIFAGMYIVMALLAVWAYGRLYKEIPDVL